MARRVILLAVAAVLLVIAGVAAVNLRAAVTFNQATASLNANIKEAQSSTADIDTLNARQQQTDAQFAEAGQMRPLLLPQVRDAIDANTATSAQLTKITVKRAEEIQQGGEQSSSSQQDNRQSGASAKSSGGLTEEQKQQVEELMKANQQSTDTQDNTADSNRQVTKHDGSGAAKPW